MAFFVERQETRRRGAHWYSYARLTEDEFNEIISRAESRFGTTQPSEQEIDDQWRVYGTQWVDSLRRAYNPINYDIYSRKIELPIRVELAQIFRFLVITVRDNQTIGAGAILAALQAAFPLAPFDFVNLFTWVIEQYTPGGTWAEFRQLIIDNLGNFDTSDFPFEFRNVPRPF